MTVWNWKENKQERRITKQTRIDKVGFSSDDRTVFAWDSQNLSAWNVASGEALRPFRYPNIGSTYLDRLVLSPDGKFLARSILQQPVRVYEAGTWREVRRIGAGKVRVEGFTPDGKGLLLAGEDGIALWDIEQGKELYRIVEGGFSAFSPDGRTLLSADHWPGTIHLWETATGGERLSLVGHQVGDVAVAFRPDARVLVSGAADTQAFLWDVTGRSPDGVRRETRHSRERLRQL